ncbi:MAG: hypothetical protein IPP64_10665 [Bacteroidetes bacterium]|nr:hypothetical protein [Bacteroidota bacterium]
MKYFASICVLCLLYSCDPYYKIQYCAKNQTTDTVYVKYKNYPDSLRVIPPGALCILDSKQGVGYAKEKYKNQSFQNWFAENSIVVKKTKENAIKKISETTWKYEGARVHGGNAVLYVKK